MLEHYHEGLVCLSACIGGEIPRTILADDSNKTRRVIEKFKELFGEDFYLENSETCRSKDSGTANQKGMQDDTCSCSCGCITRQRWIYRQIWEKYIYQDLFYEEQERKVNDALIQYADEYGIKLVATNDAHYLNKEDASTHEALLCIRGRILWTISSTGISQEVDIIFTVQKKWKNSGQICQKY